MEKASDLTDLEIDRIPFPWIHRRGRGDSVGKSDICFQLMIMFFQYRTRRQCAGPDMGGARGSLTARVGTERECLGGRLAGLESVRAVNGCFVSRGGELSARENVEVCMRICFV